MADYIKHRPENWDWVDYYINKMGIKEYMRFQEKVYYRFYYMQPGEVFNIEKKVREENRDLFIKLVCSFIGTPEMNPRYCVLSDDYTLLFCPEEFKSSEPLFEKYIKSNK